MSDLPARFRESRTAVLNAQAESERSPLSLSMHRVSSSSHRAVLRTPYLVCYGVLNGRKRVSVEGQDPQSLSAGSTLVVPPLQPVHVQYPEADQCPTRYVALQIDKNRVQSILDWMSEVPAGLTSSTQESPLERRYRRVDQHEGLRRVLDMIAYLFREDPPNRDRLLELNAEQLIVQLLQSPAAPLLVKQFARHTTSGGLAAAVQYIHDNLDRHISIDELVEEACMSKSSFYRHFSDEFDLSPLEYITKQRIARAREMLATSDQTVTAVGQRLGFSSTSYFIETFKEHEGRTPKQYQLEQAEA